MNIQAFYDQNTATLTYVVSDPKTKQCVIIDSVRDFDVQSGRTSTTSADQVIDYINQEGLTVEWILETHVHADHLTAATYLKEKLGGKIGIGANVTKVLDFWVPLLGNENDTPKDGSQFDVLFKEGDGFKIGSIDVKVMETPGHTPACLSYLMEDAVFVGDLIFMPKVGTARTDFPGASAKTLYQSIQKIYALPDETRLFTCHDYPEKGEAPSWESTVAKEKAENSMADASVDEASFVTNRNQKDEGKPVPRLLLPSIQVNLRAGDFGQPSKRGVHYIKIPMDQL